MKKFILILISMPILYSCGQGKHEVVGLPDNGPHLLYSIEVSNDQLIFTGEDLNTVRAIRITGDSGFYETFQIESSSFNTLVSNGLRNISFTIGSVYDLLITDAFGASSYSITFTLPDSSVTASKLDDMSAQTGQFLQWSGTTWGPADLSGLTYLGNWDASADDPDISATSPNGGNYYIVSVAGTTALGGGVGTDSWVVGDWAIYNNQATRWEKISNATGVTSFNSRVGAITPQANDYTWAQINLSGSTLGGISNVYIASTPGNKQVLMWDNTDGRWEPSEVDSVITDSDDLETNSITTSGQNGVVINPYNTGAGQTGELRFSELAAGGTNYVALKAPDSLGADYTYTLPGDYGTSGQLLQTNGSGTLSWADASAGNFKADGSVAMTGDLNLGGQNITNGAWQGSTLGIAYLPVGGNWNLTNDLTIDTNVLTVENGGNVGIGTTTPAAKLEVVGTAKATSFYGDGASLSGIISSSVVDNSLTVADLDFTSSDGINIPQLASNPATAGSTTGQFYYNTTNNKLVFFNSSTWNELDDSGPTTIGGREIATASIAASSPVGWYEATCPAGKSVVGGACTTGSGSVATNTGVFGESYYSCYKHTTATNFHIYAICAYSTSSSAIAVVGDSDDDTKIHTEESTDEDKIRFDTAGTERMVIDDSGNVGIGDSTPGAKLEVNGTIQGGDGTDLTPDASGRGHFQVAGNAYTGFISMDGSAMYVGHNSNSRRLDFMTDETARMSIAGTGNVGIGTDSPSYRLHVNGSVAGIGPYNDVSDIRFKRNFTPIADDEGSAIEKIRRLSGKYFYWRHDEFPDLNFEEGKSMGVVAQEVEKVFPEAISFDKDNYMSVAYSKLIAPIIEAIKELFEIFEHDKEKQNKRITLLEKENKEIKRVLCELKPDAPLCALDEQGHEDI